MISEMAMEDVESLAAKGITLSPRDVVRLNGLGLKVELHKHSSELYALPRVAFLDDVVFHEPTVGAELWLKSLDGIFDFGNPTTCLFLRAYSMVTPLDKLPTIDHVRELKKMVDDFIKEILSRFTMRQIHNAVMYALNGNAPETGECPPANSGKDGGASEAKRKEECLEVGLLREGVVLRLGSFDDLCKLTVAELQAVVSYTIALKYGTEQSDKSAHERLLGDYHCARQEILDKATKAGEKSDAK